MSGCIRWLTFLFHPRFTDKVYTVNFPVKFSGLPVDLPAVVSNVKFTFKGVRLTQTFEYSNTDCKTLFSLFMLLSAVCDRLD